MPVTYSTCMYGISCSCSFVRPASTGSMYLLHTENNTFSNIWSIYFYTRRRPWFQHNVVKINLILDALMKHNKKYAGYSFPLTGTKNLRHIFEEIRKINDYNVSHCNKIQNFTVMHITWSAELAHRAVFYWQIDYTQQNISM